MKRIPVLIFILIVTILVFKNFPGVDTTIPGQAAQYYLDNFIKDTGALNAVTAIYLNYRVYDTLFETLTLLVSVLATIRFSRYGGTENER